MATGADAHRLILRGGGSAAAGYAVRFGARLLFMFAAARLFGATLFGAYALAVAVIELAVAVGGLGMKRYLFRLLEERPAGRTPEMVVWDAALLVTAASALIAGAIVAMVLALPSTLIAPNTAFGILVVAPMIVGQALLDLLLAATRWKQTMRYEVAARSLVEPYVAIAALLAAAAAGFDRSGLLISYWAGTLAALAYAIAGVRARYGAFPETRHRLSTRRLQVMLESSALPTLTDLTGALFARLDLYLVGMFLGEAPAGVYGMARQMRTPARQVRQSFDGLLTPAIARTLAASGPATTGAATASAARLILVFQLVTLVALVAAGRPVLAWFGPEFVAGYWAMVILVAAETILGAFGVGEAILLYRRPQLIVGITSTCIAINLVAAWLLVPPFGADGAAAAVLVAVTAGALVRRRLLRTHFGISLPLTYSAGPILAGALGVAAALLAESALAGSGDWWIPLLPFAAGLAAYAAALKAWLAATGETLELVQFTTESPRLAGP